MPLCSPPQHWLIENLKSTTNESNGHLLSRDVRCITWYKWAASQRRLASFSFQAIESILYSRFEGLVFRLVFDSVSMTLFCGYGLPVATAWVSRMCGFLHFEFHMCVWELYLLWLLVADSMCYKSAGTHTHIKWHCGCMLSLFMIDRLLLAVAWRVIQRQLLPVMSRE